MSQNELVSQDLRAVLRRRPENPFFLRGFGPLVAVAVLLILVLLLLPSVSREHLVPADPADTTVPTSAAPRASK